ncbi:PHD finger protein 1-like isoform X1 [Brienomyrus brachyistius]|uniref:PHD finger protein 1-like isoform X1 n=1 Tax=Brienomyrus brachyistius TaxID=42636 RepID=UPI0020B2C013|nr:PHD finger protein 1-like isoform X1 [Brienomyrus brachyistius]
MGGLSEGDDVLARWSDGLLYLGNVKRVDGVKQCCLVRFEDNSEFWVLRKDIHSFSAGIEGVCCVCDAPPLKEPLVNCHKCRHGYHPQCHVPSIEVEADCSTWICRQCVFAVATKRGGAMKRGRFARLMQIMKLRLPYQLSELDWDPQHLTNQQQCYCYCAGPGEWNLKMLQCGGCGQWFHEACMQCLTKPLLYGDRFYQFECSVCTKGPETIERLPMSWVDLAHLVLYHLSLCCKRKYFDFDHEILSFANENWESLLLGTLSDTPRQDRCKNLLDALNSHKDRFVSGKEIKKKKCLFGLQVRAPPPLTSDLSPFITDPPLGISPKRSPLSALCQKGAVDSGPRKSKRHVKEVQPSPQGAGANPVDLMSFCRVGGTNRFGLKRTEDELNGSAPKRMFALHHPSCNRPPGLPRVEESCDLSADCVPVPRSAVHHPVQKNDACAPLFPHDIISRPGGDGDQGQGSVLERGLGSGEAVRILAKRVTLDGKVQYLVEWENVC